MSHHIVCKLLHAWLLLDMEVAENLVQPLEADAVYDVSIDTTHSSYIDPAVYRY